MPRYTDRVIDRIKQRLTLSEVVRGYVPVVSRGGRNWIKCPFHGGGNEKTPSCKVDDKTGTFHCFACGESGDMFTFVEKEENLTFNEAVEKLAALAGVELETEKGKSAPKQDNSALYELNSKLVSTFQHFLASGSSGAKARDYLSERRISPETQEKFALGYAPSDPDWLYSFLSKKGYTPDFLRQSGLFSQNHERYPLFADRLVFPVRDRQGRTIGFSGRDLSGRPNAPKYINTPETAVYSKRHNVYGLYESQQSLRKEGAVALLVEGNFDVVSMHQAGVTTAMAPLGTAFTEEQATLISRYTGRIDLMFDSDSAGQASTDKACVLLHSKGLDCNVHTLTMGKDASEILEKEGEEALRADFGNSVGAFDYLVNKTSQNYNIRTPRGKSDFVRALGPFIQGTQSGVEKEAYLSSLSMLLSVPMETIREDLSTIKGQAEETEPSPAEDLTDKKFNRASVSIDLFAMLYLVNHRMLFRQYRNRIKFTDLRDREAQVLYMALENAMRNDVTGNELFLSYVTEEKARNYAATSFELEEYSNDNISALEEATDRIALRGLEENREILSRQLRMLPDTVGRDQLLELLNRKKELDKEINSLRAELFGRTAKEE